MLHTGATTTDTAAADLSAVSVAVEGANGASTNVTASVNGSGQIVWHDPAAQQPGWAEPGSYQLSFSAAGYASPPPVQVTVPINTSCTVQPCAAVNIGTIDFFEQPSVTVVAVNSTGTAVNGATFVLYDPATTPPTVVSTQQAPAGANSVTFTGLSLHSQSSYNYQLDVYLNCEGVIVAPFKVSYGQVTDTVTLQSTSCIQGTVSGVVEDLGNAAAAPGATGNLVSPLAGVTVSAGNGLSAVTTSNGSFAIFGNPTAATLGVPPGSYTLSVSSVSGYGPATFWDSTLTTAVANPVTVNSGAQTTIGIALVATDITVSGQVTDQATGQAIPGATMFFQGSLPTSPATPGACNPNGTPPAQPSKIAPITTRQQWPVHRLPPARFLGGDVQRDQLRPAKSGVYARHRRWHQDARRADDREPQHNFWPRVRGYWPVWPGAAKRFDGGRHHRGGRWPQLLRERRPVDLPYPGHGARHHGPGQRPVLGDRQRDERHLFPTGGKLQHHV